MKKHKIKNNLPKHQKNIQTVIYYPRLEGLVEYYLNETSHSKKAYIKKEFLRMAKVNDCLVKAILNNEGKSWTNVFMEEILSSFDIKKSDLNEEWLRVLLPKEKEIMEFLRL